MDLQQAEDLISQLSLPADASVLVQEPKYWHPTVCQVVFEKSDELGFEDPQAGLEVARQASKLVDRLPGEYRSGEEKTLLKGRSFVILGSRLRQVAMLREAELAYLVAAGLSRSAPPLDIADMYRRMVQLRTDQRLFRAARALADHMIRICREAGDQHLLGCGFLARGAVHFDEGHIALALDDWKQAAESIDPKRSFRRYYGAVHNLSAALVESAARPEDIDVAVEQIQRAKAIGYAPESLPAMNLLWLEGRLLAKVERDREAEATYRVSLEGLEKLGAHYERALLTLDLAELLCKQGRLAELVEIAAQMFPLFASFRVNREMIAALRLFHHAAIERRVTFSLIAQVRGIIEKAARRLD